jgi:hypothetical protein
MQCEAGKKKSNRHGFRALIILFYVKQFNIKLMLATNYMQWEDAIIIKTSS